MATELKIAMPDAQAGYKGVQVRCPLCHEQIANLSFDLADGSFTCAECGDTVSFEEARQAVEEMEQAAAKWRKLLNGLSGLSGIVNGVEG